MMLMRCFYVWFFPDFLAIQMGTHNICLNKEVDKKYTVSILKTTELLDSVYIGYVP